MAQRYAFLIQNSKFRIQNYYPATEDVCTLYYIVTLLQVRVTTVITAMAIMNPSFRHYHLYSSTIGITILCDTPNM